MSVGLLAQDLTSKQGKPAYVTFKTEAKHLPVQSKKQGRYIAKDVIYVTMRQVGAADSVIFEADRWEQYLDEEVAGGRMPQAHADMYRKQLALYKAGQDIPLEGTPIKGWQVITPAQADMLVHAGVRTVEDLATLTDEGLKRVGMGAVDLKQKAQAWISTAHDKGMVVQEVTALKKENDLLKGTVDSLTEKMQALEAMLKAQQTVRPVADDAGITATDLMDDEKPKRKR